MKNKFSIILSVFASILLIGCGSSSDSSSVNDLKELEIVQVDGDRVVYHTYSDLVEASDLVIIGEFKQDSQQNLIYEYSDYYKKDVLTNAISTNQINVTKVLKGDIKTSTINISQRYGILDEQKQLVTFSEMTAMNKGEQWIFFLYYDEENDTYWCSGDFTGRYPVPDDDIKSICKTVTEITEERSKWLSSKTKLSESEVNQVLNKDGYVFTDSQGINYQLNEKSDIDTIQAFNNRITACIDELDASKFGVYDTSSINIELYCEIISSYGLA